MNLFSKILSSITAAAIILSSAVGVAYSPIYAEEINPSVIINMDSSYLQNYSSLNESTYTETVSPAVTTTVDETVEPTSTTVTTTSSLETEQTETTVSEIKINPITVATVVVENTQTSTVPQGTQPFNVFEIYEAHERYLLSTTTTTTTKATTVTTTTTVKTTTKQISSNNVGTGISGIDVSKWQGTIDWNKVKASGVDFAIIRAGFGKLASQEDPMFDTNMSNAKKAGVNCGVYWYSYATTVEEAYQEAEVCYSIIKDYSYEYPVVFDIEDKTQVSLSTALISEIIDAFCTTLQGKGYYVSLYSYYNFLTTKVYASVLAKYDIWVAHYGVSKPSYAGAYGMWQYSRDGVVDGIPENTVDLNYAYKDYPYLISSLHKNGY